jgi:hypothetical protein
MIVPDEIRQAKRSSAHEWMRVAAVALETCLQRIRSAHGGPRPELSMLSRY